MKAMKTYFVEVEKGIDWENGYLDYAGMVTSNLRDAAIFDDKNDAENEAALFNIKYGRNGRIYARVR